MWRARLSQAGWLIAIAVAYLYAFPNFPAVHSANELPRVYLVKAMAHDHTFAIDHQVARWGTTADVSPFGNHQYSNKAPGSSWLVLPVYWVVALFGEPSLDATMWISRVVSGVIPSLLFLALLAKFLARFSPDPNVRRVVLVAYALGTMAFTYSCLFFAHQLSAICVASAWIFALDGAEEKRHVRAFAIAGFLIGCAPLVDYQAAFAAVPLAVHIIWKIRHWPRPALIKAIAYTAIAAAIPIAALLAYHTVCFGGPLHTGYGASTTFAVYHQQGFLGITKLRSEAFIGSTIAPHFGLFALSPFLLLAFPGYAVLWKRERAVAIVCAVILVIYVLFVSSINFWRGGWSVGPRYIVVLLPFLLPPITAQLDTWKNRWVPMSIAGGLALVGIVVFSVTTATFPYWPESFRNPLHELALRLLREGHVAPNLGTWLGLPAIVSVVPYFVVVTLVAVLPLRRLVRWRGVVLAFCMAMAVLLAYRALPGTANVNDPYGRVVHMFHPA
ncbi:MAG TPA: hypothetical protein VGM90_15510 [Kofleriaceae bacterium]